MTSRQPDAKVLGETLVPFPTARGRVPPTTAFRSTWLVSSLAAVRECGHFARYDAALDPAHREAIASAVAGVWLPQEVCLAHYRALDGMGLARTQERDLTHREINGVKATSFGFVLSLAKQSGATPWTVYSQLNRVWERTFQGGAVAVHQQGPKDALLEVAGWTCARIPYVRRTMPQIVAAVTELFCKKAYVTEVPALWSPSTMAVKASWA